MMRKFLLILCGLVYLMILVGGSTRLTQSGLSMVDWHLITGMIPPLTTESWERSFELYKQFPQYKIDFPSMSLSDYKVIFYWEYAHRILGRILGLFFLIGLLIFSFQKKYSLSLKLGLWGGFVILVFQGLLGWYMVQSGLIDNPRVSPYRLTAHLGLAFFIFAYLFWFWMREKWPHLLKQKKHLSLILATGICFLQIIYGGFMAGLKAGKAYNTFPTMNGQIWPFFHKDLDSFWSYFFEKIEVVQFIHRGLAWCLLAIFIFLFFKFRNKLTGLKKYIWQASLSLFCLQFLLGVLTLLLYTPLSLALLHQSMGFFFFLSLLLLTFQARQEHS